MVWALGEGRNTPKVVDSSCNDQGELGVISALKGSWQSVDETSASVSCIIPRRDDDDDVVFEQIAYEASGISPRVTWKAFWSWGLGRVGICNDGSALPILVDDVIVGFAESPHHVHGTVVDLEHDDVRSF